MAKILTLILISLLALNVMTQGSPTVYRFYKGPIEKFTKYNIDVLLELMNDNKFEFTLGDSELKDAKYSEYPSEKQTPDDIVFDFEPNKGISVALGKYYSKITGVYQNKNIEIETYVDKTSFRVSAENHENPDEGMKLAINDYQVDFSIDGIKVTIDGKPETSPDFIESVYKSLNSKIEDSMALIKENLDSMGHDLEHLFRSFTNTQSSDSSSPDIMNHVPTLTEDYLEVTSETRPDIISQLGLKFAQNDNIDVIDVDAIQKSDNQLLYLVNNENVVNAGIADSIKKTGKFGVREILKILDEEGGSMVSMIEPFLKTQYVGMVWKEIVDEFGSDKEIDAECSLGNEGFLDLVPDSKNIGFKFTNDSSVHLNFGFGCAIRVKVDETYQNFRSFYTEAGLKVKAEIGSDSDNERFMVNAYLEDLTLNKVKIFKKKEPMVMEEMAINMMANMGLNMVRAQANDLIALYLSYFYISQPDECTGIRLENPKLEFKNGLAIISVGLDVNQRQPGCDIWRSVNDMLGSFAPSPPPVIEEDEIFFKEDSYDNAKKAEDYINTDL